MEVMSSELELFSSRHVQNQTDHSSYKMYTPLSAITKNAPIQFVVAPIPNHYLILGQSYLYLRTKIVNATDGAPAANAIGPINLPIHSAFSDVEIELGGKVISEPSGMYGYRAYLETLLTYLPDVQDTQLQMGLWKKDTAGQMDVFNCAAGGANTGLVSRSAKYNLGVEVELMGRLHCDIFHQSQAILGNVPLKIKLTPSKDSFMIMSTADLSGGAAQVAYKFVIMEANMYILTQTVTPSLSLAHEKILQTMNARYPIRRVKVKHISIPNGSTSILHDNIFLGQIPERIVLGLVSDAAMSGGYQTNPYNFQNFGVNYLALSVNNEMVPKRPFQPDFTNNKYIRDYSSLFEGMGLIFSDRTVNITRDEYPSGYTLWVFDLTPDKCSTSSVSPQQTGAVRLELKFATATNATLNVILYAEFESEIEIDKYRNVIAPF